MIALGLLGSVLISAAGLVTLGNRQIRAGSLRSTALTIARTVLEETATWGFRAIYGRLGCSADGQQCSVEAWHALAESRLPGATVEVRVETLDGLSFADARVLRLTVTVAWPDGPRTRTLRLMALRV